MTSSPQHWDHIFSTTRDEELGWYEENAGAGLILLQSIPELEKSTVFIAGNGTSRLTETLLRQNCRVTVNDISQSAIDRLILRLGTDAQRVDFLCQDISHPLADPLPSCRIWIDRAVLHFLLQEHDIQTYFQNLCQVLQVGGYALFAEFAAHGAPRCAGLDVHRYSASELAQRLGRDFELLEERNHIHITPSGGKRPYVCALFRRTGES
jgi:SAM-dependent methyltransferase